MGVPDDDKAVLDGILLYAEKNQLTLMRVVRKSDGEEVTLLCCQTIDGDALQIVPVAEIVMGQSLKSLYDLPPELLDMAQPFSNSDLDVGITGYDKPA